MASVYRIGTREFLYQLWGSRLSPAAVKDRRCKALNWLRFLILGMTSACADGIALPGSPGEGYRWEDDRQVSQSA